MEPVPKSVWPTLVVAWVGISAAAPIAVALDGVDPLAKALWRTALVAALLSPGIRWVSRGDLVRIAIAGVCLAGHFALWFASLEQTSVLRSTVLVCTSPLFAGLFAWILGRERPRATFAIGAAGAVLGIALMTQDEGGSGSLGGDGLALVAAVLAAIYFLLGREVRPRVGITTYAPLVCLAAAVALLPVCLVTETPLWGYSTKSWLLLGALALGPQLLGHNGMNYALRYLPASFVTLVSLLEPVGATLLAVVLFGTVPSAIAIAGAAVVVGAVAVALYAPSRGAA